MVSKEEVGLKDQYILARGIAPGWRARLKIVRARKFIKEKLLFFPKMMFCNSVRNEFVALFVEFSRTVFLLYLFPRASFWFVPPSTCPRLDYAGLSGQEI